MEQTIFPIFKSRPMRPFLSTHLITSTPDSHQTSKRIKGLLGYSEHFKGNRVDYPNVGPNFSPLRTRDYRKARELTLEIWDPMIQTSFLEKFLKSQNNLQTIRIKVLTEKKYKGEILKRLCEILSKNGGVSRVHIDFDKEQMEQVKPELIKGIRSMRILPKLRDLGITIENQQILPFSVSLTKVGFDSKNPVAIIQKLMKKTLKFHQLDTIKIDFTILNSFMDGLVFIISKLPNFRELNLDSSKNSIFSLEQVLAILDTLVKAPKFEILRLELPVLVRSQVSLLKHPLFKAKSLKRTSLSLGFVDNLATSDYLNEVFDLLGEVPSLYELSLRFSSGITIKNEISEAHMEKISRITSIRKLKIVFDSSSITLSEKQAGDIFKSIFKMHFLEELDLKLPQHSLGLNGRDIQGLPRLEKASLHFHRSVSGEGENNMLTIVEILGKCHQLRELELKMLDCVPDFQEMTMKLCESLRKLKRLQVFKLSAMLMNTTSIMTMDILEDLMMTCHQLRDLQDLSVQMGAFHYLMRYYREIFNLRTRLSANKKYRRIFEWMTKWE